MSKRDFKKGGVLASQAGIGGGGEVYLRDPSNVVPSSGATDQSVTLTLESDSFLGTNITHIASEWQIFSDSGLNNLVHESGEDAVNLTSYPVPSGAIDYNTQYYWRVRHIGQLNS